MQAILYKKARKTTQSGRAGGVWVLEHPASGSVHIDPVTGWSGGAARSVQMAFDTREEAVSYADRRGVSWREIGVPDEKRRITRAYADNFAFTRRGAWTH